MLILYTCVSYTHSDPVHLPALCAPVLWYYGNCHARGCPMAHIEYEESPKMSPDQTPSPHKDGELSPPRGPQRRITGVVWNGTPTKRRIWLQKMSSAHWSFNDPLNDIVKAQQEEQTEAPCPALPNSQHCSPRLCSLTHWMRVWPHAAAWAKLLTVASLKNSLLPTSFLCRVTRHSSASCYLS